ncbi:YcgN family cysteine cluster protein [Reinekea marina]|uniref:YcgN family cysteine cluster protein n=1 Tax=Reinekea marina TaxID=1310421 RepID=A0ABV7WTY8_9GAMM|nr:YcgN family cysteine cluster protein [Reinekea marina]MDN3649791.1 YcgN family cysteine cluster protein [Reinekea marina]
MADQVFWQTKTLQEMSRREWESLCDGCGKCCLQKLEDEEDESVYYTSVVCQYMTDDCRCSEYQNRQKLVPNCVWLKPEDVDSFFWLPSTCAYRLIAEGKPLPDWHPLVSGDPQRIHAVNVSVTSLNLVRDNEVTEEEWQNYVIAPQ